jgi:hypothetical protein
VWSVLFDRERNVIQVIGVTELQREELTWDYVFAAFWNRPFPGAVGRRYWSLRREPASLLEIGIDRYTNVLSHFCLVIIDRGDVLTGSATLEGETTEYGLPVCEIQNWNIPDGTWPQYQIEQGRFTATQAGNRFLVCFNDARPASILQAGSTRFGLDDRRILIALEFSNLSAEVVDGLLHQLRTR